MLNFDNDLDNPNAEPLTPEEERRVNQFLLKATAEDYWDYLQSGQHSHARTLFNEYMNYLKTLVIGIDTENAE